MLLEFWIPVMLARYKQLEKVYRTILKRLFDFFFFFRMCYPW